MSTEVPPVPENRPRSIRRVIIASAIVIVIAALTAGVLYLAQRVREMHAELMQTASLVENQFDEALNILNSDPLLDPDGSGNGDRNQWQALDPQTLDPDDLFNLDPGSLTQDMAAIESYLNQLLAMTDPQFRSLPRTAPQSPKQQNAEPPQPAPLPVSIAETADAFIIEADMPGVMEDHLRVSVEDDTLTIVGRRAPADEGQNARIHLQERNMSDYQRVIRMLKPVDEAGMKAHYENGVLTVILPKEDQKPHVQPVRTAQEPQRQGERLPA